MQSRFFLRVLEGSPGGSLLSLNSGVLHSIYILPKWKSISPLLFVVGLVY